MLQGPSTVNLRSSNLAAVNYPKENRQNSRLFDFQYRTDFWVENELEGNLHHNCIGVYPLNHSFNMTRLNELSRVSFGILILSVQR